MLYDAHLQDLLHLGEKALGLEEEVVPALLGVEEDSLHGLEKVHVDLLKIRRGTL